MSVLSDTSIRDIPELITPFRDDQLQPASYDLTIGELPSDAITYWLRPKQFILASTKEKVSLPNNIVGRMEGKSSLARQGLIIHTAGFVDPGFVGQLVLEITNLSDKELPIKLGQRIAQIAFQWLDKPAERPYGHPDLGSHYQHQVGITHSKL